MSTTPPGTWQTLLSAAGFSPAELDRWTDVLADAGERATRAAILRPYDTAVAVLERDRVEAWQRATAHLPRRPFSWVALRDAFPAIVYAASLVHRDEQPIDAMRRVMRDELAAFQQLPFIATVTRALEQSYPMLLQAMTMMFKLESNHGECAIDVLGPSRAVLRYDDVVADIVAIYVPTYLDAVGREMGLQPCLRERVLDRRTFEVEVEWS